MVKYWINQDGVQEGPLTFEELKAKGLTRDAYVWREGLAEWVPVSSLAELTICLLPAAEVSQPALSSAPEVLPEASEVAEVAEESVAAAVPPVLPPDEAVAPAVAPAAAPVVLPAQQQPVPAQPEQELPPTNLVWAIITTVLCCVPCGVVAILYASKVSSALQSGDLAAARSASEKGAWWCIGGIVAGIVFQPLLPLLML
jgi:hypothetical protein